MQQLIILIQICRRTGAGNLSLKCYFSCCRTWRPGDAVPAPGRKLILQAQHYIRNMPFVFGANRRGVGDSGQGCLSPLPHGRTSYQGDPGTGVEATGLLPFSALSSLVTSMDGGSFQQKEKDSTFFFNLNTHLQLGNQVKSNTSPADSHASSTHWIMTRSVQLSKWDRAIMLRIQNLRHNRPC